MSCKLFQVRYGFLLDTALVVSTPGERNRSSIFQAQHHQLRQQIAANVVLRVNRPDRYRIAIGVGGRLIAGAPGCLLAAHHVFLEAALGNCIMLSCLRTAPTLWRGVLKILVAAPATFCTRRLVFRSTARALAGRSDPFRVYWM